MKQRVADYTLFNGPVVEYDADAPCESCGLPVESASMGGTAICPSCDCGMYRDGTKWTYQDATIPAIRHQRALAALDNRPTP